MKFYVDLKTQKVEQERETPFFQTENLVNKIIVAVTGMSSGYFLSMEFLLPNGKKTTMLTPDSVLEGEELSEEHNGVNYLVYSFTLSNRILAVSGLLQFTCYIHYVDSEGAVTKRGVLFNGTNSVIKTVSFSNSTILIVEEGQTPEAVVESYLNAIQNIEGKFSNKLNTDGTGHAPLVTLDDLKAENLEAQSLRINPREAESGDYASLFLENDRLWCDILVPETLAYNSDITTALKDYVKNITYITDKAQLQADINTKADKNGSSTEDFSVNNLDAHKICFNDDNMYTLFVDTNNDALCFGYPDSPSGYGQVAYASQVENAKSEAIATATANATSNAKTYTDSESGKLSTRIDNLSGVVDTKASTSKVNEVEAKLNNFLGASTETLSGIKDLIEAAEEWSEDETILEAIGKKADKSDVDNKLDKVTSTSELNRVYIVTNTGIQQVREYTASPKGNTLAYRTDAGRLKVGTPVENDDATPKKYVDDGLGGKVDKVTTPNIIYGTNSTGNQTPIAIGINTFNALSAVVRTATGTIRTATPTDNNDATPKSYVDDLVANLPTGEGSVTTEEVGTDTEYPILELGTKVEANVETAEDTPTLESIGIAGTPYKLGGGSSGGGQLYNHCLVWRNGSEGVFVYTNIVNNSSTPLTNRTLGDYIITLPWGYIASGVKDYDHSKMCIAIRWDNANGRIVFGWWDQTYSAPTVNLIDTVTAL